MADWGRRNKSQRFKATPWNTGYVDLFSIFFFNYPTISVLCLPRIYLENQGYPKRKELRKIFPWRPLSALSRAGLSSTQQLREIWRSFPIPPWISFFSRVCQSWWISFVQHTENLPSQISNPAAPSHSQQAEEELFAGEMFHPDTWRDEFLGAVGDWTEN